MFLKHLSDAGSPQRDALPHHVRPEHGAHPVPALAPQPRRTRAGPRAPAAPRWEGRRARQLRTADAGLYMDCEYHQEPNTKNNPHVEMNGEQKMNTFFHKYIIPGKSHPHCRKR